MEKEVKCCTGKKQPLKMKVKFEVNDVVKIINDAIYDAYHNAYKYLAPSLYESCHNHKKYMTIPKDYKERNWIIIDVAYHECYRHPIYLLVSTNKQLLLVGEGGLQKKSQIT